MTIESVELLVVRGAREHNLAIDELRIPKNRLIVFTGLRRARQAARRRMSRPSPARQQRGGGHLGLDGWLDPTHDGIGLIDTMLPLPTIEAFDHYLLGLGLRFEGVVIGGSALGLMGIIQRPTRDFDILAPELPSAIASAARDFAKAQRQAGIDLLDEWFNNGPMQLGDVLPVGWRDRVQRIFAGQVLVLTTLGRSDLLRSKLFALCDRGTDLGDCIALAPTAAELEECVPWLEVQDGNEQWPEHVRGTVADLSRRLGHGL